MIKITKTVRKNAKLYNIVREMNHRDKGFKHTYCNLNFSRPSCRGYFYLLWQMYDMGVFTWVDLMMHGRETREFYIRKYIEGAAHREFWHTETTFHRFLNSTMGKYRTFFKNYDIIETIGKPHLGKMRLTELGKALFFQLSHSYKLEIDAHA